MWFAERRKEISKKMDYIGYNKIEKNLLLLFYYNPLELITKGYLKFEEEIANQLGLVKCNEALEKTEKSLKELVEKLNK